jgi:hypothetical protein
MGEKLYEDLQEKTNNIYDTREIRVYTREDCTAKIHEEWVKNPPNNTSQSRDGYISQPCTQLGLTRLADFAKPTLLHPYMIKKYLRNGL